MKTVEAEAIVVEQRGFLTSGGKLDMRLHVEVRAEGCPPLGGRVRVVWDVPEPWSDWLHVYQWIKAPTVDEIVAQRARDIDRHGGLACEHRIVHTYENERHPQGYAMQARYRPRD